MRALITGINGFVGQHLTKELNDHGWQVFGLSDKPPFSKTIFESSVLNSQSLSSTLTVSKPDAIFHLAGFTSVGESWKNPELAMMVNRDGTAKLMAAMNDTSPSAGLLITSSAEVYGHPQSLPITEDHQLNPSNPYSKSKLEQERVAEKFPKIQTVICRSFPHTGPGQSPTFVTSDFARQIVRGEHGMQDVITVGNLDAQRDFTDVRDTVKAYRLLIERRCFGQVYNICSGISFSIKQLLDLLLEQAMPGTRISVQQDPDKLRPNDIPELVGSHEKLTAATQWKPSIDMKTTLHDILEYWRHQEIPA